MQQPAFIKSTSRDKSKRRGMDRPLCMNTDKLLAILPYLTKRELDKCQEVCQLWDKVIERHWNPKLPNLQQLNDRVLTQRRRLFALSIGPSNTHHCWRRPLDLDLWRGEDVDEERAKFIDNCARFLTGKLLFPHEDAEWNIDVAVMVDFERDDGEWRGALVRNRLDPQGARLIARLLDRLEDVFLEELDLNFNRTPELDADAEDLRNRFYISPFLLVLTGKRLRLTARYLTPSTPIIGGSPVPATSARSMARTLDLVTKCDFLSGRNLSLRDFLEVAAVGRGYIRLVARKLNLSTIEDFDRCVEFFKESLQSLNEVVPCVEVHFKGGLIQPRDELLLTANTAVSHRKERRKLRVYKFSRTNVHSGEAFYIELYSHRPDKKTGVLRVWAAKFLFPRDAD